MGSIVAIDPGTSATGLVRMDAGRFIEAETLRYPEPVKADQSALMRRAAEIARRVAEWMGDGPREAVVVEGFVTYHGRQSGYTFQTPYLCGYLHAALAGEPLVVQTSREALNPRTRGSAVRDGETKAAAIARSGWANAPILSNEHLRSAALHGIHYYNHREEEEA